MSDPWLERRRERIFAGEDRKLYLHLGYFLSWFSAVESKLTMLIAILTESRNFYNFDLLCRGLQPKQKVERLRLLANKYRPMGPNLANLLEQFEDTHIRIRNGLSHNRLIYSLKTKDTFVITSLSKMTEEEGATPIASLKLFEHAYWLHNFNDDLQLIIDAVIAKENLEIDDPKTPLRKASNRNQPQSKRTAILSTRQRRRLRKGQPLRGTRKPAE